jgi:hypothetical protein
VTETRFTLEPLTPGSGPRMELLFQDVSKIRSIEPTKKDALLEPLVFLALISLFVLCGTEAIFHKECDL